MAKLYFRYGAMGSGKSIDLLKVAYNYKERGQNILILTSSLDNRFGNNKIASRIGVSIDAICVDYNTNILELFRNENNKKKIDCVLVDESQFLKKNQILQLSDICDLENVPVIAYGLRSDFKMCTFEGSEALLSISDIIEEVKTICWCGKKAITNARICDGKITTDGEQIFVGNINYISLCRKHFKEGKLCK